MKHFNLEQSGSSHFKDTLQIPKNQWAEGQSAELPPVATEAKHTAAGDWCLYEDLTTRPPLPQAFKC